MKTAKRRFPIGEHPNYDKIYDKLKLQSPILNNQAITSYEYSGDLGDKDYLESLKLEWEGGENGVYYAIDAREYKTARVPQAKAQIENIEKEWEVYKQQKVNAGRAEPKEYPHHIAEKMDAALARYDIAQMELEHVQRKLEAINRKKKKADKGNVLRRGAEGTGSLKGGVLAEVDGQNVEADEQGVLRIKDERSPYDGMKTADYFEHIVKPWKKQRAKLRRQQREKVQNGDMHTGQRQPNKKPPLPKWDGKDFDKLATTLMQQSK